jgi:hypothetical protein
MTAKAKGVMVPEFRCIRLPLLQGVVTRDANPTNIRGSATCDSQVNDARPRPHKLSSSVHPHSSLLHGIVGLARLAAAPAANVIIRECVVHLRHPARRAAASAA